MKITTTLIIGGLVLFGNSQAFGQSSVAPDCTDAENGCTAVEDGFPISPSGYGAIEESNNGANNVSWPPSNPQGVNSGCMFANELNSTWISFTILNDGILEFTLGSQNGGYYDWIMWQNNDGLACEQILNDQLAPVSCNWNSSSQGFTGMADWSDLPPGAVQGNFQPPLNVQAGDQFILCFSNYSGQSNVIVPFNNYGIDSGDPNAADFICSSPTSIANQAICSGDTATLTIQGVPPNITSYSWSPATNISDPNGGPSVDVWPTDTTVYTCTMTSPDSTWSNDVTVFVHTAAIPNAGMDDSTCHSSANGYTLNGALGDATSTGYYWTFVGPTGTPAPPNAVFLQGNTNLTTDVLVNYPGQYYFVLNEPDIVGICPDQTDTVAIFFSKENHTYTTTEPSCAGAADGSITVTSTGILGAVEYSFDGGTNYQASNTMTGLTAGTYTVISRDIVGCTKSSTVNIVDPPAITITATGDSTICINGSGLAQAVATGGPAGTVYTYYWDHTTDNGNTQPITPNPAGTDMTVEVYAITDLGCYSDTDMVDISHYDPISLTITANDTVCPGYDASHMVTASGGYQGYNYSWTANGTPMSSVVDNVSMNPQVQTTYCVTVTDGCETDAETICSDVIMRAVPVPIFTSDTTQGCNPTTIEFTNITDPALSDSVTWLIDGVYFYNQQTVTHVFDEVGTYDVWMQVHSPHGCYDAIMASEYITVHEQPVAMFYMNPNPTTIFNTEIDLNNTTEGNNTYQWYTPGATPASSSSNSPTVVYPNGIVGDYPVELIVTSEFNCVDSVSSVVHVLSDVIIYAPNVFTPDGDEYNETWRVYIDGIDIYDFHLTIYNRWGEIVWESYNDAAAWDGTYGSRGTNDNTFVWVIEAKDIFTDKKYEFRGHVTVLK